MTLQQLITTYHQAYGKMPAAAFFCPGRLNLIGEHIDYNGGLVMPCAIDYGTYLLVAPNDDQKLRLRSLNFEESIELPLDAPITKLGQCWYNYPLGIFKLLGEQGIAVRNGFDFLFYGNLPIAAGLSSSASIEMVTGFAIGQLAEKAPDKLALVKIGKAMENGFIGVNSGIMDQFSVVFSKKDNSLLLDCQSLSYETVPATLPGYSLVIINTNKARALADSKYNERVEECAEVLDLLKSELPVSQLCAITPEQLYEKRHLVDNEILWRRARHVVEENARVKQAAKALRNNDIKRFGTLMNESHASLKELYEVSGRELDVIAEYSKYYRGVLGARMTGAGFGGCAIAIVESTVYDDYKTHMTDFYTKTIGYAPDIYKTGMADGVHALAID